ncbi:MAG TPA: 16S rRNA (uracil(1498)-N(3))-methyltransferase [Bauldia sp.]|nr:16S rRNA (uracil(1498)-N(3))-methyltransferase [Bauldia sp.]
MPDYDFTAPRLFLRPRLAAGMRIALERGQANYLVNVLRLEPGSEVLVFNGVDGEWSARLHAESRKSHALDLGEQRRPQPGPYDLQYLFAPLKQARLDYMVGKAVEMGAGRLRPVITQHTQVTRLNLERMRANAIEAAEQCGILSIPAIDEPLSLRAVIEGWEAAEPGRRLIFCDESEPGQDPVAILAALPVSPLALLVGPEGGFSAAERQMLRDRAFVTAIPLGPRILRADTAAVAALALVQAVLGDWKPKD